MILINKPQYLTSYQTILAFQKENLEYANTKLGYVGTLDPMATGLLIVLENEENRNRNKFIGLCKTYEFEILFGISTDTYDLLGLVTKFDSNSDLKTKNLDLTKFIGKYNQKFPPFSAKIVNGQRLYNLSRNTKIQEIDLPSYERNILSLNLVESKIISKSEILSQVKMATEKIVGNFRQENILNSWIEQNDKMNNSYKVMKIIAEVSSGTYIRRLCVDMANKYNTNALAYSIKRTKVGDFDVKNSKKQLFT